MEETGGKLGRRLLGKISGWPKRYCKPLHIEENFRKCWSINVTFTGIVHVLLDHGTCSTTTNGTQPPCLGGL